MAKFQIYKNLAWLNDLADDEAERAFLDCCASADWARRMTAGRPYNMLDDLYNAAEKTWFSLPVADHLEAFAAHPKIGGKKPSPNRASKSAKWSATEQAGVDGASSGVRKQLGDANRLYQEKFGFIFIVCATGKTADEMLAICRARLGNSVETELQIAAAEQAKITAIRLDKLLEK